MNLAGFARHGDGVRRTFSTVERQVLGGLADDLRALVEDADADASSADPVLARLAPDAVPDDPEASEEFRGFTRDRILEGKQGRLEAMSLALDGDEPEIVLDAPAATAWLLAINDIRLALAERLGLADDATAQRDPVYDWLTWLQDGLVTAIDRH